MTNNTEQHRLECEARHWLKATAGKKPAVDALMERLGKARGAHACGPLKAEMLRQHLLLRDGAAAQTEKQRPGE